MTLGMLHRTGNRKLHTAKKLNPQSVNGNNTLTENGHATNGAEKVCAFLDGCFD